MSRRSLSPAELFDAACNGDRGALARVLSLLERGDDTAREVGRLAYSRTGAGYTVGITGAPGAGKSTLTSAVIKHLRAMQTEVAVLAIDPSSPFTGGAILGDRVRMQDHATDPGVFIRSMATRGHLGGLARATADVVLVLEHAGFTHYNPEALVATIAARLGGGYRAAFFAASAQGHDLVARTAAKLRLPYASDVTEFSVAGDTVRVKHPGYTNKVIQSFSLTATPALVSLRGGAVLPRANAKAGTGKPTMIVCDTLKGKGVKFMEEGQNAWHGSAPNKEQADKAIAEILGGSK